MTCAIAPSLFRLLLLFPIIGALDTKVEIEDLCDSTCKFQGRVLDYPKMVPGFTPTFNFSIAATAIEALNPGWRYSIKAHILGVLVWQSSGAACGETLIGDNIVSIVTMGFPSCDTKPGNVTIPFSVQVHVPLEMTPIYASVSVDLTDGLGAPAAKLRMRLGGWDETDNTRNVSFVSSPAKPSPLLWPGTHIEARNLCDDTCLVQDLVLNVPDHFFGPTFKFEAKGTLPQQLSVMRFGMHAVMHVFGKLPVSILLGNGTACGKTTTGDGITFGLELDFPPCPVAQGLLSIVGHSRFTLPIDVAGRLALTIDMTDGDTGARVASVLMQLHFGVHKNDLEVDSNDNVVLI